VQILDNVPPTIAQMQQFLHFATIPANSPCYVHREKGKGRTGVAVACYRMAVNGWSEARAVAEARKRGLSLPSQLQFLLQFAQALSAGPSPGIRSRPHPSAWRGSLA
jgi:protein tyrosine/serine phosphatase